MQERSAAPLRGCPGSLCNQSLTQLLACASKGADTRGLRPYSCGFPYRFLAKGTQPSGSSSQSSISFPPCFSALNSITWAAGSWVRACRAGWTRCGGHPRDLRFLFDLTGLDEAVPSEDSSQPCLVSQHHPFSLQTLESSAASSTCSTQTASGSAAGPFTRYMLSSPAPSSSVSPPPCGIKVCQRT